MLPKLDWLGFLNYEQKQMTDTHNRRTEDTAEQRDIEHLIASENDSKIRLQLMVMNRINLSLIANTEMVNEIAIKLEKHLTIYGADTIEHQAILNKGRGAWKVLAWVLGIVQTGILAVWLDSRGDMIKVKEAIGELTQTDAKATARSEANAMIGHANAELLRQLLGRNK